MTDEHYMSIALKLAERNLGLVAPNPSVGCVIVKYGVIIGEGQTAPGGRPHAETVALTNSKMSPQDSIMYVTLEPCCHQGVTGPCADEIIRSKIKKVVVATVDPDKRVSGGGIKKLIEAGVEVVQGVMKEEAEDLNIGFFTTRRLHRPWITCKIATTLDGKIASASGDSKWITQEDTREWVHQVRAKYDAVMIGSNTLVSDDPLLTCRIPGMEDRSPVRIIIDSQQRLKETHKIAKTADKVKTWIVTNKEVTMKIQFVNYLVVESNGDGKVCMKDAMEKIASVVGITRLLVEGGGGLLTELLKENLIDRLIMCRSGKIIGNDGVPCVRDLGIATISKCLRFRKVEVKEFSEDVAEVWDKL
ncbi:riboflavin biosynthesis protein RibD-like [Macrosteles quadrilineatus]|uniref:riboflavin biosynthesis protein RibD-like n=1 Tax=Macrosteles quadrilineatus TaxID=74068 RepID=UPI0023E1656D|nr:riboflavin biosynthesis protein RibD-like [Macrosteles quadrilineatus]